MGNLDQQATDGLTGSTGPTLLLRSIFAELIRNQSTHSLPMSAELQPREICLHPIRLKLQNEQCDSITEWFAGKNFTALNQPLNKKQPENLRFRQPTNGLRLAYDPRIPQVLQHFEFQLQGVAPNEKVEWFLNGNHLATTKGDHYPWPVTRGEYQLQALIWRGNTLRAKMKPVKFVVK